MGRLIHLTLLIDPAWGARLVIEHPGQPPLVLRGTPAGIGAALGQIPERVHQEIQEQVAAELGYAAYEILEAA